MEKNTKRALRRHHLNRMKAKASKVYWWHEPERAAKWANHLAACSCYMCGNPRKWWNESTMQERRFNDSAAEREWDLSTTDQDPTRDR